ncbi:hypothetical protein D3C84_1255150 [compost metagenome]
MLTSRLTQKYTVSALAVRNSDLASINPEKIKAVLFGMPASWKPLKMAATEAPW